MIALNDETTTFQAKFHPFLSTIDVVYDKTFRRETSMIVDSFISN